MHVYSEPGQGSTFKMYLPALALGIEEDSEVGEVISSMELQGHGEGILLVEDDEEVHRLVTRLLCGKGYVVFGAANMQQALDTFERERENIHLVFSDMVLPDGTGLQLVDQLLSHNENLRVLLSSGYTDDRSQLALIQKRGFQFLQKPYTLSELLQAVRQAIEG